MLENRIKFVSCCRSSRRLHSTLGMSEKTYQVKKMHILSIFYNYHWICSQSIIAVWTYVVQPTIHLLSFCASKFFQTVYAFITTSRYEWTRCSHWRRTVFKTKAFSWLTSLSSMWGISAQIDLAVTLTIFDFFFHVICCRASQKIPYTKF